jgi:hypothetical protein
MAPYAYGLMLTTPAAYADGRTDAGSLPAGISARFAEAAPLVNYGLLAGEALGVDATPALELLDEVNRSAEIRRETDPDAVALLSDGDVTLLRDVLAAVAERLAAALDRDGHPVGAPGEQLTSHEHVHLDDRGRAVLGTRGPLAVEIAERLPDLVRFLTAAADRDLYVVMQ